ncbi:HEAT repeat domain-containing protein [Aquisphaera insulae]|uniref:HEAT repeat domain-containing protein n=1 Tax=Aquisphaera insulae TaxID=2712864 RepID=UPI0013E9CBE3|nr:HEAT repeat domain-containing protein [Aquisphaera insulae]
MTAVADYMALARSGRRDVAFHGLLELEDEALPELEAAFRRESDTSVRSILVKAIWGHRQPVSIPFLAQAIADSSTEVWQSALDGLVTLASPRALLALKIAHETATPSRRPWIAEAIEQVSAVVEQDGLEVGRG